MSLVVERCEGLTLVQDLGRPGHGAIGVSPSGAFDRTAHVRAQRILGNEPDRAGLEIIGRLALRAESDALVTVTGAIGPVTVDDEPAHHEWPVVVRAGQVVHLQPARIGLRTYLGVQGGIAAPETLGSRSFDSLSHLGPEPLRAGDRLEIGNIHEDAAAGPPETRLSTLDLDLDVHLGPRDDWFTPDAVRRLFDTAWTIAPESDRVGVRLSGPSLRRRIGDELPSEPCLRGSIQVSSDGQPIIFGPDHPVTGGYPVIAVLTPAASDLVAQAQPGRTVHLHRV